MKPDSLLLLPTSFVLYVLCLRTNYDPGAVQRLIGFLSDGGDGDLNVTGRYLIMSAPSQYVDQVVALMPQLSAYVYEQDWDGTSPVVALLLDEKVYPEMIAYPQFDSPLPAFALPATYLSGRLVDRAQEFKPGTVEHDFVSAMVRICIVWLNDNIPGVNRH